MTEETIELREIIRVLRKRIWIIVIITMIAAATSGIISVYFMTPIYKASTQLLVNNSKDNSINSLTSSDLQLSLNLISTYMEVIKSPRILDLAAKELGMTMSSAQLGKKIDVSTVKQSQIISITVHDPNQHTAAQIANTIAKTFQREVPGIMQVDNVQILAEAQLESAPTPVKPRPALNIAIAFVVGLMTSIGLIFLIEYMDNTIKNETDVEHYLQLPVLGMVAPIDDKTDKKLKKLSNEETRVGGESIEA